MIFTNKNAVKCCTILVNVYFIVFCLSLQSCNLNICRAFFDSSLILFRGFIFSSSQRLRDQCQANKLTTA